MAKPEVKDKSIIDPKYRDKYRTNKDWAARFIDSQVQVPVMKEVSTKHEDGTVTTELVATGKTRVDLDRLFGLAVINKLDIEKYREQVDRKNATGRLRMTIGNMIRAAGLHRHGLYDLEGTWNDADAEFLGDRELTQDRDGNKIPKAKAETAKAA